ncbi:MAG: hypothetical protein LDL41_04535 [Coleofasciculus sp. S288]|nr:hypothetical protein [Coleofasciculus sp. S288]
MSWSRRNFLVSAGLGVAASSLASVTSCTNESTSVDPTVPESLDDSTSTVADQTAIEDLNYNTSEAANRTMMQGLDDWEKVPCLLQSRPKLHPHGRSSAH